MSEWTPAQQRVIDLLGKSPDRPRASFDPDIGAILRRELDDGIADLAERLPGDDRFFVSKHAIGGVHGCEARFLHEQSSFDWSPATARGTVAHRAIELSVHVSSEPIPAELVDEAIARLIDADAPISRYLEALGEYDRADLRSLAVNHVARFLECFPPLRPAWIPRTESRLAVDLADGRVRLSGKVDLMLGRPGDKVIIDLKTGSATPLHREDLRFYALLDTITLGVPPRKLASYYLDEAVAHPEDVTEAVLVAAVRRTIAGIRRLIEIQILESEPVRRAGPPCRWCALAEDCSEGIAYLDEDDR
jgi:CRISPR/Cas system-associated exonuclease Cas4 (RecB family)